ncbi:MAG TPA: DUF4160 domain-containing protein [Spirochaetota bacterium]|nr:DUF4160 domain-containing protein [Spirochaetota bacterium]HPV98969.1 DUF4160 domain-containing protein [Spirochaetota bacterium]
MPKVFEWNGYKFFFFSNEGIPREPCHIHVRKGEKIAKFWVDSTIILDSSWGLSPAELTMLNDKIEENRKLIMEKWNEFFGE